jgi:hypothetical protein
MATVGHGEEVTRQVVVSWAWQLIMASFALEVVRSEDEVRRAAQALQSDAEAAKVNEDSPLRFRVLINSVLLERRLDQRLCRPVRKVDGLMLTSDGCPRLSLACCSSRDRDSKRLAAVQRASLR